jgi:hypothetical protein
MLSKICKDIEIKARLKMTEQEIRDIAQAAMREVVSAKNSGDRMDAMEETLQKHGDALNEINEKLSPKEEKKAEGENAAFEGKETPEEEKEEKAATLENAKPSQAVVAAFSTAMNVDFGAKTPSFSTLASLAGIKETDPALRIAAVNTKFAELLINTPKDKSSASNSAAVEVF